MEKVRFTVDLIEFTMDGFFKSIGALYGIEQAVQTVPQVGDLILPREVHLEHGFRILFNDPKSKAPYKNQEDFIVKFVSEDFDTIVYERLVEENCVSIQALQPICLPKEYTSLTNASEYMKLPPDYFRAIELLGIYKWNKRLKKFVDRY